MVELDVIFFFYIIFYNKNIIFVIFNIFQNDKPEGYKRKDRKGFVLLW